MRKELREKSSRRRGAMMMLMVFCIPIVLMFSAFAINVAWMQLTRTELRTATDAAARAGSRTLSLSQDTATARSVAQQAAARNTVAGDALILADTDVVFGESEEQSNGKWDFRERRDSSKRINGVRVTGDRSAGSASGAVPMLFSGIFDRSTFEPVKQATATQLDRDVFLVLDRSGSMNRRTPTGTRWRDLKKAVRGFLQALEKTPQDELVGIVTYSSSSTLDEHMQLDYEELLETIDDQSVGGMTAIGRGLQDGIAGITDARYARTNAARTIVVMTDGHHNRGIDPEIVAQQAREDYGITVHTVTFSSGADRRHMRRVAAKGGGKHWHADDQAQLVSVFEEIANNLPTLITE